MSSRLDLDDPRNRLLGSVLLHYARVAPDQPFLRMNDLVISYAEAADRAVRFALGLQQAGLGAGDRLCLMMEPGPDYVMLALAASLQGIVWVPVNTDYRGQWLAQTLHDSQPSLLLADPPYIDRLETIETGVLRCREPAAMLADAAQTMTPLVGLAFGDTASIMWTSGTTGKAKGVMQSHNTWIRSALSAAEMGGLRAGDVTYNVLPLHNSAAWVANIFPALLTGATCAMDATFSAGQFWERTRFYGATHIFTLGAMHMFLWGAEPTSGDADNPVRSANMVPMPDEIATPFKARFGIDELHQGFGQSEVMLLMRRWDQPGVHWPANALGAVAADIEVVLKDDSGEAVGPGETGEACVRPLAPHVLFNGYFNNPDAEAAAFRDGWYHTGDLLRSDQAGNYYFVDRKNDLIRYKGRSVSSLAVEHTALAHPQVAQAAAFGIASKELAAEHEIMLAAVLTPDATLTPQGLAEFINDNAPYYYVPRYIEFVAELPMTPTQKVRKVALRERGVSQASWDAQQAGFVAKR
jgi:crotonobetaine/carnitine-CoA ligase